jgi:hypothetical protein
MAYGGVDLEVNVFLTSALVGGEWSASRPCRFTPGEMSPGTYWIGGSVIQFLEYRPMGKQFWLLQYSVTIYGNQHVLIYPMMGLCGPNISLNLYESVD